MVCACNRTLERWQQEFEGIHHWPQDMASIGYMKPWRKMCGKRIKGEKEGGNVR